MYLPKPAWAKLNRLRTGVGLLNFNVCTWALSATLKGGDEEQSADCMILEFPQKLSSYNGAYVMAVLKDETINQSLNSWPEI